MRERLKYLIVYGMVFLGVLIGVLVGIPVIVLTLPLWIIIWILTGFLLPDFWYYIMGWLCDYEWGDKFEYDKDSCF